MLCSLNKTSLIFAGIVLLLTAMNISLANDIFDKEKFIQKMTDNPLPAYGPTDDPPPAPVIAVAEWEPATGVAVAWPLQIPVELIAEMAEDVEVWTTVSSEQQMQEALGEYVRAGVDTSNCHFLFIRTNMGPYTRDHGPWYIINGDDEQGLICNQYWGPVNWMPIAMGDTLEIPVYETGMNSEGGNYQTDGMGRAIVTWWVYLENNELTEEEIDQIMFDYLGIESHIVRECSGQHMHVDTWAKLLDPGRILVIIPNGGDPLVEENVEFFESMLSSYGRPYEVIRIEGSGYSNTLFLNNKVLVPQFGDPTDSLALVTWAEAMPGYEVHGYYWPTFVYGDALHCRTHEMADRYMLRIIHVPIHDCENTGSDYHLTANIHPYSNEPLVAPPQIYWKIEGGAYNAVSMSYISGDDYEGNIPQQPDGTDIYYYIEAEDGSDRIENHPYIGPGNPHHFHVSPDNEPPVVEFDPPGEILAAEFPYSFTAYALDNRWISSVTMEWSLNGISQDDIDMPLEEPFAVYYTGIMSGDIQSGDVIEARVKVVDTSLNLNTTYAPEAGYYTINVASSPNVTVTLTPAVTPIQIPANGGSFDFTIEVSNNTTIYHIFDFWTMVIMPDSSVYGPVYEIQDITAPGGFTQSADKTQNVPEQAPQGVYNYCAYVGYYPDIIWNQDNFEFEKMGTADGLAAVDNWNIRGEEFGEITQADKSIPTEFRLHPAYPNPFNPATTIRFDLPEEGKVSLKVFDVNGREVAKLVDGYRNAGTHEKTFDGSDLSSGIYFARLDVENFSQTRKMLLVK